ncbi:hypothetical protein GOP47_0015837 [Adiantum capillus-veneris]|uniref:Cytokinin riboside 5'-monophosphate phosphoribohydrolase n=1 Tax=Adiantum capillus-veneris TaxID=13818 RepID=A0A9D4ZEC5_ADICA|nr:hypothetical protein GOP47_0015837 [Adiantum capillus-veneris]
MEQHPAANHVIRVATSRVMNEDEKQHSAESNGNGTMSVKLEEAMSTKDCKGGAPARKINDGSSRSDGAPGMAMAPMMKVEAEMMQLQKEIEQKSKFKRICVFCGSKSGKKAVFSQAALQLGKELVDRKVELVYGGGSIGLMGLISKTVFEGGCHVIGVIPEALTSHQMAEQAIGEMRVVADMHERKAEMARIADAFIAMPGGYGTLEELLEMITWSQLGIHDKPVGLLNVDGYYDSLLTLFDKSVEEGFMKVGARQIVLSAPTPKELLTKMQEYVPVHDIVASRQSWEIQQLEFFST